MSRRAMRVWAVMLVLAALSAAPIAGRMPTPAGAAPLTHPYAYIPSQDGVTVIDVSTNTVVNTVATGALAQTITISPDGRRAYLANTNNTITVLDTVLATDPSKNGLVATISLGPNSRAYGLAVSPDGKALYAADELGNNLLIIDPILNQVTGMVPVPQSWSLAVSPDGSTVYVGPQGGTSLAKVNVSTQAVTQLPLPFSLTSARMLLVSSDGSKVYIDNNTGPGIAAFDTTSNTVSGQVPLGNTDLQGMVLSQDGGLLYASDGWLSPASGHLEVVDTTSMTTAANPAVPTTGTPVGIALSPDGKSLYVVDSGGAVLVVDAVSYAVLKTIPVGVAPSGIGQFIAQVPQNQPAADLALSGTATPNPVAPDKTLKYSFTVKNVGPSAATGVTLTDTLTIGGSTPAGGSTLARLVSITPSCILVGSGVGPPAAGTKLGTSSLFTCTLGNLATSTSVTIALVIRPVVSSGATIASASSISGDQADPDSTNNVVGLTTLVGSEAPVPARLAFTTQPPSSIVTGQPFPVAVAVQDKSGAVVNGDGSTAVTLTATGGKGALSCDTNPQTDTNGVAAFRCSIAPVKDQAETYTLHATAAGLTKAASTALVVQPLSDATLIQQEQAYDTAHNLPQPASEPTKSCVEYAQDRGLTAHPAPTTNLGAYNLLYVGDDATANHARLKPGVRSLAGVKNLTNVLQRGDFIVWQPGAGAPGAAADKTFGHMAVVELVLSDRVVISETDWSTDDGWRVLHVATDTPTGTDLVTGMYAYPASTQP
jgi:uncharacterized repeat protein (TIGR01451 family)